jgi:hypothetical protein
MIYVKGYLNFTHLVQMITPTVTIASYVTTSLVKSFVKHLNFIKQDKNKNITTNRHSSRGGTSEQDKDSKTNMKSLTGTEFKRAPPSDNSMTILKYMQQNFLAC